MLGISKIIVCLGAIVGGFMGYRLFRSATWFGTCSGLLRKGFQFVFFGVIGGAMIGAIIVQGISKVFVGKTISKIDTKNGIVYYENQEVDDEDDESYEPIVCRINDGVNHDESDDDSMVQDDYFSEEFKYLMENGLNGCYIDEDSLNALSARELTYLRNSVYARHGYIFKSQELNNYFAQYSWYVPNSNVTANDVTSTEQLNAEYILQYQKKYGMTYQPN